VAAAMVALGVAIYMGRLGAQNASQNGVAPPPQTKIALLNVTSVLKGYEKFKAFQEEMKSAAAGYQKVDADLTHQGEALYKEANTPTTTAERKEAIEQQLKELKRKAEDNKNVGTKALSKRQEQGITTIYLDIYHVAERIAKSRGFEMILQFNDLTDQREYWSAQNIMRKLQAPGCTPMYWNGGLEITQDVVTTLNSSYKTTAPRPAGH
jgi:Skp family chaperone for outer membrane proteins